MANLSPVLRHRYLDANGAPLAGGKLYSYQAGTTTPQATYTDSAGNTANANPIVLDANGEASMWLDPELSYKFILTDLEDNQQWSVDNVVGLLTADSVVTASISDGAVTTAKLDDDAVTSDKLRSSADTDGDRAVGTNHIKNSAVTTAKIADNSVTTAKFAAGLIDGVTIEDSSGVVQIKDGGVSTAKIATNAVTRAKLESVGQQVSAASGSFSTSSSSYTDITNLSVSITTTGRPVFVAIVPDTNAVGAGAKGSFKIQIMRGATPIATINNGEGTTNHLGLAWLTLDAPAAGTYTYKAQASSVVGTIEIYHYKLVAYEL